jgi:cell pole-organizing protein PopZ
VLELTEMVEEVPAMEEVLMPPPMDVLANIDQAIAPAQVFAPAAEEAAPAQPDDSFFPTDQGIPEPAMQQQSAYEIPAESLISAEAAAASLAALKKLQQQEMRPAAHTPSPAMRSGLTVEDMMMEAIKPMLREWLDANLPQLVERIVEREIRKLTS